MILLTKTSVILCSALVFLVSHWGKVENFMDRFRVAITGLGVLAPNASGKEAFWQACLQGQSGVREITHLDASSLPTRIAGNIPAFSPASSGLTPIEAARLDAGTQFALAAAR